MRSGAGLCSAVFNSEWERSKYHILEDINFTYFQHKMYNKADCPATNHSANMQTYPTSKPPEDSNAQQVCRHQHPRSRHKENTSAWQCDTDWGPALINAGKSHDYLLLERWTCLPATGAKLTWHLV